MRSARQACAATDGPGGDGQRRAGARARGASARGAGPADTAAGRPVPGRRPAATPSPAEQEAAHAGPRRPTQLVAASRPRLAGLDQRGDADRRCPDRAARAAARWRGPRAGRRTVRGGEVPETCRMPSFACVCIRQRSDRSGVKRLSTDRLRCLAPGMSQRHGLGRVDVRRVRRPRAAGRGPAPRRARRRGRRPDRGGVLPGQPRPRGCTPRWGSTSGCGWSAATSSPAGSPAWARAGCCWSTGPPSGSCARGRGHASAGCRRGPTARTPGRWSTGSRCGRCCAGWRRGRACLVHFVDDQQVEGRVGRVGRDFFELAVGRGRRTRASRSCR